MAFFLTVVPVSVLSLVDIQLTDTKLKVMVDSSGVRFLPAERYDGVLPHNSFKASIQAIVFIHERSSFKLLRELSS